MTRAGRWIALAHALATTSTCALTAWGDEPRSVVVDCDGPRSDEIASRLAARLSANYAARDSSAFRRGLGPPSLAAAEKGGTNDAKLVAHARTAARTVRADAAILVHVRKTKRALVLHVRLVDATGEGGAAIDQSVTLGPRASVDDEAEAVWNAVSQALPAITESPAAPSAATHAPSVSPVEGAQITDSSPSASQALGNSEQVQAITESRDTGAADSITRGAHPHASSTAVLRASLQAGTRSFSYVDRITPSLRSYGSSLSPLVSLDGEIYPLAHSRAPLLKDLGITADYATAFALSAADSKGNAVRASWNAYDIGARERIAIGRAVLAGVHGGYGAIAYSFGDALGPAAQLPSVAYRFVRGGLDVSVATGRFTFYGSGSYLNVLSAGPFGASFPRARVGGIDARAGATRSLGSGFEIALEVDYTRFFYSLHPEPGDAYVAGGALDQLARLSLGVARAF